jgi:hypothetical protein
MHWTAEELRQLATRCRDIADMGLPEHAKRPPGELADEFEVQAEKEYNLRQKLIGSGRC